MGAMIAAMLFSGAAVAQSISSLTLNPSTVVGGDPSTGTVVLSSATSGGIAVNLSSSLPAYASVPSEVTIGAGSKSATFSVTTVAHGRTLNFTITAAEGTSSRSAILTSLGDAVSKLTLLPSTVKGGQISGGTISLVYPAPAWGWTVNLVSSGASVLLAPSITIPAGTSTASFTIMTSASALGTSTISATDKTTVQKQTLTIGGGFWLTNSPWPKFGGNLQNQGQGWGQGANGTQKWRFKTNGQVWSSPAIGDDGTVYVGSDDYYLYALTPTGTLKWKFQTEGPVNSSPAIGSDETIYVGGGNSLYAINSNGTLKWKHTVGGPIYGSSPTIQSDGTVSVGSSYGFYEITGDGALKYNWPSGNYPVTGSPSAWGNDLFAGVLGIVDKLMSFGSGSLVWSFPLPVQGSTAVGPDGTIYAGSSTLNPNAIHGVFPTGKSDWVYNVTGSIESGPAVGLSGDVFVASTSALYGFSPHGTLLWSNPVGGSHGSSPSLAADGTIYVGLSTGSSNYGMYAFNPNGTVQWKFPTTQLIYSSPAIDKDGTLYFGCLDGYVYAITSVNTSYGLIHEWKFNGNAKDSVGSLNGTIQGPVTYAPAVIGEGMVGDGETTGVTIPAASDMQFQKSFSLSAWAELNAYTPDHLWSAIIFDGDDRAGYDPYYFSVDPNGTLNFAVTGITYQGNATPVQNQMPLNQFVLVTGVYDQAAGILTLYQNGKVVDQQTGLFNLTPVCTLDPNYNPGMGLGTNNDFPQSSYNFSWNGTINDVRVYNRALNSAEVAALYNQGKASKG